MKNRFLIIFSAVLLLSANAIAQTKAKMKMGGARQKGKTVLFTVNSTKPFIVGSNIYILHIGNKDFGHSEQSESKGKGTMTFFIPGEEYKELRDGVGVYVSYGQILQEADQNESMEELCKENHIPCWSLGKFSKKSVK